MEPSGAPESYLTAFLGREIPFFRTKTLWRIGNIQKEKTRVHDEEEGTIREATGVCTATQVDGASFGEEAIIKIKLQLSPWDDPNFVGPSREAEREIENLEQLTKKGCKSTPRIIDHGIFRQGDTGSLPNGYIVFILMEKVPGQNLGNFHNFSLEERNLLRIAFIKAVWEFRSNGFYHHDPRRENLVWDNVSQRCFIVDLEDAEDMELTEKDICLDPLTEFSLWNLRGKEKRPFDDDGDNDPMIPIKRHDGWMYYNKDELLQFLTARADKDAVQG
ncbi:hypothetical protein EYZ11_010442 [Aspergillus tanneri]|uniref:Protein kinase domain-containing protein n=1 Tax=Aspergillus tanneri TaxID=1220188 RepID=A0A4V3UN69_9EURO|nr:hypothetical protein EYZ11_010442 [Aspergillus tanneri]